MSESQHQQALFQWAALNETRLPELKMLVHVPNGGLRNAIVAKKLKAEGVKKGFPDLLLLVPRGGFHGFVGEMKYGRNKLTKEQVVWLRNLAGRGYCTVISYDWAHMAAKIERYLQERL